MLARLHDSKIWTADFGIVDAFEFDPTAFTLTKDGNGNLSIVPNSSTAIADAAGNFTATTIEAALAENAGYRMKAYTRTFDHADTDIAVAATTAAIDFGAALPAGAIVHSVLANVTQDFDDGAAGTFSADVGISGGTQDAYTPTALDIDGGIAVLAAQTLNTKASGVQLAVTFDGSANLSTLTTGTVVITVLFFVPDETVIAAP